MERSGDEMERRLCGSTPMEKENEENGLEKRREECDLGEVEGKRETHSLSLGFSFAPNFSLSRLY